MKMSFPRKHILAAIATVASLSVFGSASAQTILVDFGDVPTAGNWNIVNYSSLSIANAVTSTGASSGISIDAIGSWGTSSAGGTPSTGFTGTAAATFGGDVPTAATDYFYTTSLTSGVTTINFSGLSLTGSYTITLFAGRNSDGNRTGLYDVTGATTSSQSFNATLNTSEVVTFANVTPDANGTISVSAAIGAGNDKGFAYLNAIKLQAVPEPGTYVLLGAGLFLVVAFRKRVSRAV